MATASSPSNVVEPSYPDETSQWVSLAFLEDSLKSMKYSFEAMESNFKSMEDCLVSVEDIVQSMRANLNTPMGLMVTSFRPEDVQRPHGMGQGLKDAEKDGRLPQRNGVGAYQIFNDHSEVRKSVKQSPTFPSCF